MPFELLRTAAARAPEQPALILPAHTESYAALLSRSERIAQGLRARGITRFGCAVSSPADSIAVLAASAAAGAEACLYPPELDVDRGRSLAARFGHEYVVVDPTLPIAGAVPLAALEEALGHSLSAPDQTPLMILTTGTTGPPKGARYDWSRLTDAAPARDTRPGARWLLAYNVNQFAGIQILLHAFSTAATLVIPGSRQPDDVIETIREHHVTHVSATPTFWRLMVGRLDAERASRLELEQITLGGEAAPDPLIRRLRELFPLARLSHVYAGTEFGSVVSVRDGRSGLPLSVLQRDSDADVQFRIRDGELQIRSRVGMLGYYEEGAENSEAWRSTGDLVEIRDGRIEFVGRLTEIINVGGAKVHPLPVEELICSIEGVELAAAYGRSNAITGQIVAVDVVAARDADTESLERQIRSACLALPSAARPRRVRFVAELELRGNKVQRREIGSE